jgi:hypothetical protein
MVHTKGNAGVVQTVMWLSIPTFEQVMFGISKYYVGISVNKEITSPSKAWPTSGTSTTVVHVDYR